MNEVKSNSYRFIGIDRSGVHEVENGSAEAQRTGAALQEIIEQINTVSMQVSQIATAAEEQTSTQPGR